MKTLVKCLLISVNLMVYTSCSSQIKNSKTIKTKIYGNCGMCKKTIDEAGSETNISQVNWDIENKFAVITYDSSATNLSTILKKIASSGYDNELFYAPKKSYKKLHECCKYERKIK
jgi:hypothetical protein